MSDNCPYEKVCQKFTCKRFAKRGEHLRDRCVALTDHDRHEQLVEKLRPFLEYLSSVSLSHADGKAIRQDAQDILLKLKG